MKIYIHATGNISPQKTFGHPPLLQEAIVQPGNRMRCMEPDYSGVIDVKMIRRMSRIIKMGVAAAMECLQEAGIKNPDAIVTGTAYGCLEDTGVFLKKMVEQKEEMLTPTAFIQSTHNTIGAQIALLLQCHHYNNTFVHRGFSFESALLDAMMLLEENSASNILVGAVDEITDISHAILSRFGLYKKDTITDAGFFKSGSRGTIAGEGAAFFLLRNEAAENSYAVIEGLQTFSNPGETSGIEEKIASFLNSQSLTTGDIDLFITGQNGDQTGDAVYRQLENTAFKNVATISYKQLCGEYPTSTAFALWLAASVARTGSLPVVMSHPVPKKIKKILIYNHYQRLHHSLLLVSAC